MSTAHVRADGRSTASACRRWPSANGDFSASTDQNGNPIPNLFDFSTGGTFGNKTIPADRIYNPGQAILKLWPEPNTTGLNYNYEVELPTVNTLIQQPALRLAYQPKSAWRITGKYAGQMRSHEVNSIGGAAAPGVTARIPGFNDYVEPYPWIGTISVTNNLTLNSTTFLEATYGWVQNQLGSMIISPVSNRFKAGLGDLPLLFPDAGVIDPRYYEVKPLEASGTPYFQDGRILLPPTFAWGNRVANAPPNLGFPGFMNVNRTQDFSISLTKVWERHTIKAGFYLNHSYKAQNLGAGGGASFQGNISFANDTANALDTGFGYANALLGVFTNYQQQSKFVEGSFLYDQVDWYVQDNWKVNSKLTLDYGLRFVNQRPQYDQYLRASNFFPERWSPGAAPALYVPGCVGASPCSGTNRQARNPVNGQLYGPNTTTRHQPARAQHGRRPQRHREGRRRHLEIQLRMAGDRLCAAVWRGLQRHIIKGNMVWDLPKMSPGDGAQRVLAAIVNDWQLSGILTAGTGAPSSIGFSYAGGAVGNAPGGTNAGGTGNQNLTGSPSYAPRILITGDPGSGCADNQYAEFNTAAFTVPTASASNPSLGLASGQNYMHGCFDKTVDLALARNFRLGGNRNIQFRIEAFNAFNTVVYNARNTTLQVQSPVNLTASNPQYDASGNLVQTRLTPQNAGFGASTGAQNMRSMQMQIRFQF